MKALAKNWYVIAALAIFAGAAAFLAIIFASYSASTSVDSTTVGNIYIGAINDDVTLKRTLKSEVESWKKEATYTIKFQGVDLVIGLSTSTEMVLNKETNVEEPKLVSKYDGLFFLDFNYDETIKNLKKDSGNVCYFSVNEEKRDIFYAQLLATYGEGVCGALDYKTLMAHILNSAQAMTTIVNYDLSASTAGEQYLSSSFLNTQVTSASLQGLDPATINKLIEICPEIEILPQKQTENKLGFSAVKFFSDPKYKELTSSELSIIATGIAAVVQKTSFTVTVKNQGYLSDEYYSYMDMTARINIKDGTDLKIINPENTTYTIKLTKFGNADEIAFALFGCNFAVKYDVAVGYDIDYETNTYTLGHKIVDVVPTQIYNQNLVYDPQTMFKDNESGKFYKVTEEGIASELISFIKIATAVDGTVTLSYVYPKQEFYKGTSATWEYNFIK